MRKKTQWSDCNACGIGQKVTMWPSFEQLCLCRSYPNHATTVLYDTSTISPYRHLSTVLYSSIVLYSSTQFNSSTVLYSSPALQQQQPLPLLRPPTTYVTLAHNFYKLQYQWLQLLSAPVPVTTTSTSSSTSDYNLYQLQHRHLLTLRQLSQKTEKEVTVSKDQLSSNIEPIPWVKTSYPVIFPTCTS